MDKLYVQCVCVGDTWDIFIIYVDKDACTTYVTLQ